MNQPRYSSLADYRNALRRQRWVLLVVAAAFTLTGLGISLAQSPTYAAIASLSFTDVTSDLRLIGANVLPEQGPAELASAEANRVTTEEIARRVGKRLRPEIDAESLRAAVTTQVETDTLHVVVEARWSDPIIAADIANAFAEQSAILSKREVRTRLDEVIKAFGGQIDDSSRDPLTPPTAASSLAQQQVGQLRAIRDSVEPAEIIQRAEPQTDPVAPSPVRNSVLGLLVGLTFGLVAAFGRDSLDRRIRTPAQAYEALGYPILRRIAEGARGRTGQANDGGGDAPIDPHDLESFRVLRTNLGMFSVPGGLRRIIVTSGLPEEGKSTVAASLAAAAAAAGQRTLLIDCDLRRPTIAARLGIEQTPGVTEYLLGDASPAEIVQVRPLRLPTDEDASESNAGSRGSNLETQASLAVISAGEQRAHPAELLASTRCQRFLAEVGRVYDLVVIDCSPLLASVDPLELIPHVDAVLLCVRADRSTLEEVEAVRTALGMLPERPTGVVLTGVRPSRDGYGPYGAYYGYEPH